MIKSFFKEFKSILEIVIESLFTKTTNKLVKKIVSDDNYQKIIIT